MEDPVRYRDLSPERREEEDRWLRSRIDEGESSSAVLSEESLGRGVRRTAQVISDYARTHWGLRLTKRRPVPAPEEVSPEAVSEGVRLDRAVASATAEARIWKRRYEEAVAGGSLDDRLMALMREFRENMPNPRVPLANTESPRRVAVEETLALLLTDLHAGEVVDGAAMHGANRYDVDVFLARMEEVVDRLVSIAFERLSGYRFPELRIYSLGDLVNGMFGAMHDELIVTQGADIVEVVYGVAYVLVQVIVRLLQFFERIHVCAAPGNHGRMSRKPWAKSAHLNWDLIVPQIASTKFAGDDRVTWNIPRSFFFLDEVRGQRVLGLHGHQVRGWASIPWYGINKTVGNLTELVDGREASELLRRAEGGEVVQVEDLRRLRVNHVVLGHFHTEAVFDRVDGEVIAGPCFPAGTPVTLRDGTRVGIEDVCAGDKVLTHTGNRRPVTEIMRRRFSGHLVGWWLGTRASETRCTPEHPVRAIKGSGIARLLPSSGSWVRSDSLPVPEWVEARYLSAGDYVQVARPTPTPGSVLDPLEARALGLFLAEGSLSPHHPGGRLGRVQWTFHSREVDLAGIVLRWCAAMGWRATERVEERRHVRRVVVNSVDAAAYLFERAGKGSEEKRLSEAMMALPMGDKREILLGWIAGDGHVNHKNRRGGRTVSATSASRDLIEQMYQLASECGYAPTLFTLSAGGPRKRDSYSLGFGGRDAGELAALLGDPIDGVEDGVSATVWVEGQAYRRLEDVWRERWDGEVFNLEVEEDHSYVANGVAVHNCLKGADEFTLSAGFRPARAGQTMFGIHPEHGITHRWRLDAQDAYERKGWLEWYPGGSLSDSWGRVGRIGA